jgi:hypothetical protein
MVRNECRIPCPPCSLCSLPDNPLHVRGVQESGRVNLKSKILSYLIFSAMCLTWVIWFMMCLVDPYAIDLPVTVRWIGFGVFLLACGLALGALIQLRGLEDIDHLVAGGLFSKLRHPMYAGFLLLDRGVVGVSWRCGQPVGRGPRHRQHSLLATVGGCVNGIPIRQPAS